MSTYWYIHCLDCKDTQSFDDTNHASDMMKDLAKAGPDLKIAAEALARTDSLPNITFSLRIGRYGGLEKEQLNLSWFIKHGDHHLRAIDEYGRVDDECGKWIKCEGCGSSNERCKRLIGHEGDCKARRDPDPYEPMRGRSA